MGEKHGAERTRRARRFNRMEVWQHHRWHIDAGIAKRRASGRVLGSSVARRSETSTEVLAGQYVK